MIDQLRGEFKFYLDNKKSIIEKYNGKVIVIKNRKIIGYYDNDCQAINETKKNHQLGTFIIQKCSSDEKISKCFTPWVKFL